MRHDTPTGRVCGYPKIMGWSGASGADNELCAMFDESSQGTTTAETTKAMGSGAARHGACRGTAGESGEG